MKTIIKFLKNYWPGGVCILIAVCLCLLSKHDPPSGIFAGAFFSLGLLAIVVTVVQQKKVNLDIGKQKASKYLIIFTISTLIATVWFVVDPIKDVSFARMALDFFLMFTTLALFVYQMLITLVIAAIHK